MNPGRKAMPAPKTSTSGGRKAASGPGKRSQRPVGGAPLFVVQKHTASHLHYDFRLEEDGVLKSWAVPKPPPDQEGVRRLAVAVEDHPLEYGNFEGVIPEGEYGAGRVEIWDKGAYAPLERGPAKRIFELKGRRLKGKFALIKLKPGGRKDDNWLLLKMKKEKSNRLKKTLKVSWFILNGGVMVCFEGITSRINMLESP